MENTNPVDYQKLYTMVFNGITRALDAIDEMNFGRARAILQTAQIEAEEAYIKAGGDD